MGLRDSIPPVPVLPLEGLPVITAISTQFFEEAPGRCCSCSVALLGSFGGPCFTRDYFATDENGIVSLLEWADRFHIGQEGEEYIFVNEQPIVGINYNDTVNWLCWTCFRERITSYRTLMEAL